VSASHDIAFHHCGSESSLNNTANYPGNGFQVNGGGSIGFYNCMNYSNTNIALYITGSANPVTIVGFYENTPSGTATQSIQIDAGSTATVISPSFTTAVKYTGNVNQFVVGGASQLVTSGNNAGLKITTNTGAGSGNNQPIFQGVASDANNRLLSGGLAADTAGRFTIDASGVHQWGPGNANRDVQIARTAAGTLGVTPQNGLSTASLAAPNVLVNATSALGDGGVGVIDIANATTVPTSNPTNGTVVYAQNGVLKWRDSNGNVYDLSQSGGGAITANTWLPADSGNLAWTFDPIQMSNGTAASTTGIVYLVKIPIRSAITVTSIEFYVSNVGSGLISGQCFAGLYNASGVLIGQTSDLSTSITTGINKVALASGPFAVSVGSVWGALLFNGTTPPTLGRGNTASNPAYLNKDLTAATYRIANLSGTSTALPASFTPSSNQSGNAQAYWFGLS
jgi:hypothetical protein